MFVDNKCKFNKSVIVWFPQIHNIRNIKSVWWQWLCRFVISLAPLYQSFLPHWFSLSLLPFADFPLLSIAVWYHLQLRYWLGDNSAVGLGLKVTRLHGLVGGGGEGLGDALLFTLDVG